MNQRFYLYLALGLAGGAIAVVSQAFRPGITGWAMFGVSLGALALIGVVQLDRAADRGQHLLDAVLGALVIWSAIASVVYTGTTLKWLSLGEALALVGLAVTGLVVHELTTEHVVAARQAVSAERTDGRRAQESLAA